jgi:hypothetical protein
MGKARGGADCSSGDGVTSHRLTYCRENPSCECGPELLTLSSSERNLQMQSTSKEKSNVQR